MKRLFRLLASLCLGGSTLAAAGPVPVDVVESLTRALQEEDLDAIRGAVAAARNALGDRAGIPEEAERYRPVPAEARRLTPTEAKVGFTPYFDRLETMRWWKIGIDPTKATAPLRAPASVVSGNVAAFRSGLDGADRSLSIATEAADFLLWAQEEAGSGLFPFPAARGTSRARAMQVGTRFLEWAERAGKLDEVVRNGWAVEDFGDGGLQFDNGECGIAMLEFYDVTKDPRHLASARRAADWAATRPLCRNWNYNAFSVDLLAAVSVATGEESYREAALHKARLGVIPGQLVDGPRAGIWFDPHNARTPYHYIMMRSLARLAKALPEEDPGRPEILEALRLGLLARNTEMTERGVMNKEDAVTALLLVTEVFADDEVFLSATRSPEALDRILRLVSEEFRSGKAPLSPGAWGLVLEHLSQAES